jgi:hypothetical protein
MLRGEDMQRAVRLAGEAKVRDAFAESVAAVAAPDGTVALPKTFRYAVGAVPVWSLTRAPR